MKKIFIYIYKMPHPAKKSKTTKAQRLASRVRQRKKEKNEFEHLEYLQSQLDENGVPLDILNTDYELLNNEQKFIVEIVKILKDIDLRSIAIYMNEHYNEEHISNIITNYYSNKESKTWADSFFKVTYKCLGILNLNHMLIDKVLDEIEYIIDNVEQTDKPVMTDEIFNNILNQFKMDTINLNELISACLLVYSQNQDYCMSGGKKRVMKGGELLGIAMVLGFILWVLIGVGSWFTEYPEYEEKKIRIEQQLEEQKAAKQRKIDEQKAAEQREIDEQILINKALKKGFAGNREQLLEIGRQEAFNEGIERRKMVREAAEKRALDEQMFINKALEMGLRGNRAQLIEWGQNPAKKKWWQGW
jgi:hypothetical protein